VPERPEPRLAAAEAAEARNGLRVGGGGCGCRASFLELSVQCIVAGEEEVLRAGGREMAGTAEDRRRWRFEASGAARRPHERRRPRAAVAGGPAGVGCGGGGGGLELAGSSGVRRRCPPPLFFFPLSCATDSDKGGCYRDGRKINRGHG
jgi:hypothetical protein